MEFIRGRHSEESPKTRLEALINRDRSDIRAAPAAASQFTPALETAAFARLPAEGSHPRSAKNESSGTDVHPDQSSETTGVDPTVVEPPVSDSITKQESAVTLEFCQPLTEKRTGIGGRTETRESVRRDGQEYLRRAPEIAKLMGEESYRAQALAELERRVALLVEQARRSPKDPLAREKAGMAKLHLKRVKREHKAWQAAVQFRETVEGFTALVDHILSYMCFLPLYGANQELISEDWASPSAAELNEEAVLDAFCNCWELSPEIERLLAERSNQWKEKGDKYRQNEDLIVTVAEGADEESEDENDGGDSLAKPYARCTQALGEYEDWVHDNKWKEKERSFARDYKIVRKRFAFLPL